MYIFQNIIASCLLFSCWLSVIQSLASCQSDRLTVRYLGVDTEQNTADLSDLQTGSQELTLSHIIVYLSNLLLFSLVVSLLLASCHCDSSCCQSNNDLSVAHRQLLVFVSENGMSCCLSIAGCQLWQLLAASLSVANYLPLLQICQL